MSKSGKETSAECDCLFDLLILETNLGKLSTCFHKSLNLKEISFEYNKLMSLLKTLGTLDNLLISDIAELLDFCRQELAVDIVDILLEKQAMSPETEVLQTSLTC